MTENRKVHTLMLVLLLTISAYFLADTVDVMIGRSFEAAPKYTMPLERSSIAMEPRRDMNEYFSILDRGLFGEGKAPSTGLAVQSLSYRLIGTVEGTNFSGAVLEDASGQTFYSINQKLPDGSMIVKVKRVSVTIKKPDGSTVDLQVIDDTKIVSAGSGGPNNAGVKKISDGKWMVDQREVASSAANMSQILTQARALPYLENGKTTGFRLSEIVPGSIYEKIGLQNGDVIQKVNSQDVDDPGKFFQLYQGLQNEQNISIDVLRGGQRQTLNYEIR
jgi:general secretion pathway protein C